MTKKRLREALRWALAELRDQTRYDNEDQRRAAFAEADKALAAAAPQTIIGQITLTRPVISPL